MPGAESTIVLFPRFTTLSRGESVDQTYYSLPLDVSRFGSAQFQIWRGPIRGSGGKLTIKMEESLDTETWVLGAATQGKEYEIYENTAHFLSYAFRLRWFRLVAKLSADTDALVTCWAEGMLR